MIQLITNTAPPKIKADKMNIENLDCPHSSLVSYWRETSDQDKNFVSPFKTDNKNANSKITDKYITFEPDVGGWNNIRMQMETVLVFAAATGRTLVIPPEQAMVLLYISV